MIPKINAVCQSELSWQQSLAQIVKDPGELMRLLELDKAGMPVNFADFPLRVPLPFIARMEKGNWADPLLQQVLPQAIEGDYQPGFTADPLEETRQNPTPGIIHKYHGRALLVVTGACAIHCRYCFRRHFPYEDNTPSQKDWQKSLEYIANDKSINEVILSGGDPLAASDRLLTSLVGQLSEIPHLKRLRVHTRLPVVIPNRITDDCLSWLTGSRLSPVMVLHINHPNEIDQNVFDSIAILRQHQVPVLNQAVLLAGINDNSKTLIDLSEALFACGVTPYYLHLLDKVTGSAHFDVDEIRAKRLMDDLLKALPGYLVPKLVRESAKVPFKVPIQAVL